jgi:hypothetical protein
MGMIREFDGDSARASNPVFGSGRLRSTVQTGTRGRLARGRTRTTLPTANLNSDLHEMIGVNRLPGLWVQCFLFRHCPLLPDACSDPVPPWSWRSSAPTPDRYRSARANKRPRLTPADRVLWVASFPNLEGLALDTGYSQTRDGHRLARKGFRLFWTWKVRRGKPGRPRVSCEVRDLGSVAHGPATETRKHTE